MSWLMLSWYLACGALMQDERAIELQEVAARLNLLSPSVYTALGVEARVGKHLRAWGGAEILAFPSGNGITLCPYEGDFSIGAAASWGPLELAIEHECDHTILSGQEWPRTFEAWTRISLTISGTTGF